MKRIYLSDEEFLAPMEERGIVREIGDGFVWVEIDGTTVCKEANPFCFMRFGNKKKLVKANNPLFAKPGNRVIVYIPDRTVLKLGLTVYVLPFFCIFSGTAFGKYLSSHLWFREMLARVLGKLFGGWLTSSDNLSLLFGLFFLGLCFLFIKRWVKNKFKSEEFRATIIKAES